MSAEECKHEWMDFEDYNGHAGVCCTICEKPISIAELEKQNAELKAELFKEKPLAVRVTYSKDDYAFISGVYGSATIDYLEEIEKDFSEDDDELFNLGNGDYLMSVKYEKAVRGEYDAIEIPAYFDLTIIEYKPFEEEATEPKAEL